MACEIVIGLLGLIMIFASSKVHDRMHGIFIFVVAVDVMLEHFIGQNSLISKITNAFVAIFAFLFIGYYVKVIVISYFNGRKERCKAKTEVQEEKEEKEEEKEEKIVR